MIQIDEALKQAMREKNETAMNALRSVKSAVKYKKAETGADPDEPTILQVIQKEVKKRRDSIEEFKNAGRADLVDREVAQLAVIEKYMPKELSDEEIEELAKASVAETGASTKKEMGLVMKSLMPKVAGRADGKRVNAIVQKLLD